MTMLNPHPDEYLHHHLDVELIAGPFRTLMLPHLDVHLDAHLDVQFMILSSERPKGGGLEGVLRT